MGLAHDITPLFLLKGEGREKKFRRHSRYACLLVPSRIRLSHHVYSCLAVRAHLIMLCLPHLHSAHLVLSILIFISPTLRAYSPNPISPRRAYVDFLAYA